MRRCALILALIVSAPSIAGDLVGQAAVIDGGTIEIHGKLVRLFGIDAPKVWKTC